MKQQNFAYAKKHPDLCPHIDSAHFAKGMCNRCYQKKRRQENPGVRKRYRISNQKSYRKSKLTSYEEGRAAAKRGVSLFANPKKYTQQYREWRNGWKKEKGWS